MALVHEIQPITVDDEEIRTALEVADLPALLPALAYITGDLSLLRDDLRIDPLLIMEDQAGLTPDQQAGIRALALATLVRYRDDGGVPASPPTGEPLQQIVEFMAGGAAMDDYMPMLSLIHI